uniref:PH domain-containing protein n=1 Tax=Panagrellus redivivus TaxID=6233 RepID=A0A7E4ZQW8_PANRE
MGWKDGKAWLPGQSYFVVVRPRSSVVVIPANDDHDDNGASFAAGYWLASSGPVPSGRRPCCRNRPQLVKSQLPARTNFDFNPAPARHWMAALSRMPYHPFGLD